MKQFCILIIGLGLWSISLIGCSADDHNQASAVVSVSPGTNVTKGTMVQLDADESQYSGDNIEWLLNGQHIGLCNHKEVCTVQMSKVGQSRVTLKVKFSETTLLGSVVTPESEDETTVIFKVRKSGS